MKRFLAGAALSLILSGVHAGAALADVPTEAVDAGGQLGDYMAELEKSENRLPKLSDPRGAELLKKLFNPDAVVAGRPQSQKGIAELSAWNDVARAALARYLGRAVSDDREAAKRELLAYQDELTLALTFLTRAMASLSQSVEARAAALPNGEAGERLRQEGREIMRVGMMGIVQGVMMTISAPELKPENSRAMTGALADDMPLFLPMLTPQSGLAIRQMAETAAGAAQDPDTVANLQRIVWSPVPEPRAAETTLPEAAAAADRQSWAAAMSEAIRRRTRYPQDLLEARDKGTPLPSGKVTVSMTLDRSGTLVNSTVTAGSGVQRLDETALQVVRDAAPFPAPPTEVQGQQVTVAVPINFVAGEPSAAPAAGPAAKAPAAPKPAAAAKPAAPKPAAQPKPAAATAPGTAPTTPKPPAQQKPAAAAQGGAQPKPPAPAAQQQRPAAPAAQPRPAAPAQP